MHMYLELSKLLILNKMAGVTIKTLLIKYLISILGDLGYSLCLNNKKLYEERNTLLAYSLRKASNGWNDNFCDTKPKLVAGVVDCKNVSGIIEKLNTVTRKDVEEVVGFFSTRKLRKSLEKLSSDSRNMIKWSSKRSF